MKRTRKAYFGLASRGRRRVLALAAAFALAVQPIGEARAASSLSVASDAAVKALGTGGPALPADAMVVAAPLASDQSATRGDELAVRIAALVAGRMGGATKAHGAVATLAAARGVAKNAGTLIYVQTALTKGDLRVTLDAYPVPRNAWDRVRAPLPPPKAHAFASAPFDAEVRSFLAPILLEQAKVHVAHHDEGDVLAAACGDLDGDGGMELVLVSRARVAIGRLRGSAFVPMHVASWTSLASRAPVPLRQPLAGASFGPRQASPRLVYVGTSDRGGVALDADLKVKSALRGIPVPFAVPSVEGDACASPAVASGAFEGLVTGCAVATGAGRDGVERADPHDRFDAFAAAEITGKSGGSVMVIVSREPSGKLRIKVGEGDARTLDEAGAQVAVGDLDLDGTPEIVSSADTGDDFVAVQSMTADGLKMRLRIPAPAGVRALAICPPEDRGVPALAAVVGSEVWIVR